MKLYMGKRTDFMDLFLLCQWLSTVVWKSSSLKIFDGEGLLG